MTDRPIGDYALLSDCHSAALVSGAGSVDWLCLPRFDSPSVFGRLLDADAGHWAISPSGEYESRRRYLPETLVLETQYATQGGMAMLTEALVLDENERGHDIGSGAPHLLVRVLEVTDGEVAIDAEFAPRPEYGLVRPEVRIVDGGVVAQWGVGQVLIAGPAPTAVGAGVARWQLALRQGDKVAFALQHRVGWGAAPEPWPAKRSVKRLADTVKGWQSWSALHQLYEGPWQEQVRHSGRVLQALTFGPTGAMVASPTTSLPEREGGGRNWDHRYCWLQDASMTMQALWIAACPEEARKFLSFLVRSAGTSTQHESGLQILYGIGGEHDQSERELPHLAGWRDSRPVRVGNARWRQPQLHVYGAVIDAVYGFRAELSDIEPETAELITRLADAAATYWQEPDLGMWAVQAEPKHFVHSKLMCWVALDRAARLADQLGVGSRAAGWAKSAETIRVAILEHGWSEQLGAFTQTFGGGQLDASSLMLATTGFLPVSDPRLRSTIERIALELSAPCGLLYRYVDPNGLPSEESTFLLCSFWLVQCRALAGELDAARETFEQATAYANDVGLLGEEAEPATGELLGNYPQAFSHVGLINAAWAIAQAEEALAATTDP
ncbi:MAG: glycoside hydrolase family 15 protein [Acidimicrobiales bacterium]